MTKKPQYVSTNRSKHYLKTHLIFVCKYRKKLLKWKLKKDMQFILKSISERSNFEIEVMKSDLDHIHFLIRYTPRYSISQIVRRLKQESTVAIWRKHARVLRKMFWYKKIFWSDGYFACSIGEASPETIRKYILSQG